MTPRRFFVLSHSPVPSNSLLSFWDPWRAFWANKAPFKGPKPTSCVAYLNVSYAESIVRCVQLGCDRQRSLKTPDTEPRLFVCKNTLFYNVPRLWSANGAELSLWPAQTCRAASTSENSKFGSMTKEALLMAAVRSSSSSSPSDTDPRRAREPMSVEDRWFLKEEKVN